VIADDQTERIAAVVVEICTSEEMSAAGSWRWWKIESEKK
jgi:hypothetical protein